MNFFWKVYIDDIKSTLDLLKLPKEYQRVLSENNSHFRDKVLNTGDNYFYLSKDDDSQDIWGWMPGDYNSRNSYEYYIGRGYSYKGEIRRLLKLKKLSEI
jgi:hypothetical protein